MKLLTPKNINFDIPLSGDSDDVGCSKGSNRNECGRCVYAMRNHVEGYDEVIILGNGDSYDCMLFKEVRLKLEIEYPDILHNMIGHLLIEDKLKSLGL